MTIHFVGETNKGMCPSARRKANQKLSNQECPYSLTVVSRMTLPFSEHR